VILCELWKRPLYHIVIYFLACYCLVLTWRVNSAADTELFICTTRGPVDNCRSPLPRNCMFNVRIGYRSLPIWTRWQWKFILSIESFLANYLIFSLRTPDKLFSARQRLKIMQRSSALMTEASSQIKSGEKHKPVWHIG